MSRAINYVGSLLLLFAVFATSGHSKVTAADRGARAELTPREQNNLETVTAFFEALNRYDADGMAELMTEGFEFRHSNGMLVSGREAGSAFFADRPPNRPLYTIELVVVGNRGWHLFSFDPPDADGKSVPTGLDLMTMRDGKIAIKDYYQKVAPKRNLNENVNAGDAFIDALNQHAVDRLAELLSDEAAIYRAVTNKPLKGREIAEWFAAIFLNWPDGRWEKKSSIAQGQRIAVEFVFKGSHKDMPGRMVESWDVLVLDIEAGKISKGHFYYDVQAVSSQLKTHREAVARKNGKLTDD